MYIFPDTALFLYVLSCLVMKLSATLLTEVFLEIGHYAGGNVRVINTLIAAVEHSLEIVTFLEMEEREVLLTTMGTALERR